MSRHLMLTAALAALLSASYVVHSAEEEKAEVKPLCPVSGRAIDKEAIVEHNGGKVYFCCNNCPIAFKKDTAKFAAKANQQLVITGQAKQEKCPITGRDLNPETGVEVAGTEVTFCCNNCKGRVERAEGAAQLELVFSDAAFKKGFKVGEDKE